MGHLGSFESFRNIETEGHGTPFGNTCTKAVERGQAMKRPGTKGRGATTALLAYFRPSHSK